MSKARKTKTVVKDIDNPAYNDTEAWDLEHPVELGLDPALKEQIRQRLRTDKLVQISLRVGQDQINEAKRVAAATQEKYQRVLRRWIAEGASRARRRETVGNSKGWSK